LIFHLAFFGRGEAYCHGLWLVLNFGSHVGSLLGWPNMLITLPVLSSVAGLMPPNTILDCCPVEVTSGSLPRLPPRSSMTLPALSPVVGLGATEALGIFITGILRVEVDVEGLELGEGWLEGLEFIRSGRTPLCWM